MFYSEICVLLLKYTIGPGVLGDELYPQTWSFIGAGLAPPSTGQPAGRRVWPSVGQLLPTTTSHVRGRPWPAAGPPRPRRPCPCARPRRPWDLPQPGGPLAPLGQTSLPGPGPALTTLGQQGLGMTSLVSSPGAVGGTGSTTSTASPSTSPSGHGTS